MFYEPKLLVKNIFIFYEPKLTGKAARERVKLRLGYLYTSVMVVTDMVWFDPVLEFSVLELY